MMRNKSIITIILVISACSIDQQCFADWISPGELTESHQILKGLKHCIRCHTLGKGIVDTTCLSCHPKLVKRIKLKKGFHANLTDNCIACHTEHKGKDYDIMQLDKDNFNHNEVGYELKGRHQLSCDLCHQKTRSYLGLSPDCLNCHTDVHMNSLSGNCLVCHNYAGWRDVQFDHAMSSTYKLRGRHAEAKCSTCHTQYTVVVNILGKSEERQVLKYKPVTHANCVDCHYDIHLSQFKGQKCDSCHSVDKEWKQYSFRHQDDTYSGYKLEGNHTMVKCDKCHKRSEVVYSEFNTTKKVLAGKFKSLGSSNCDGCHDDMHKGGLREKRCDTCHSVRNAWKVDEYEHTSAGYKRYNTNQEVKLMNCDGCHMCNKTNFNISGCIKNMTSFNFRYLN